MNECIWWSRGRKAREEAASPRQILGCQKIVRKPSCPKIFIKNVRLKTPSLRKFKGKIKILDTHNFFCQKFAAVCWNSVENL